MGKKNEALRNMTPSQREERLRDLGLELMHLRAQGLGENTKAIRDIRREVARIRAQSGGST